MSRQVFLLFVLLLAFVLPLASLKANTISYTVTLLRSPFPMLKVAVKCPAQKGSNYSRFYLSSGWSTVDELENEVHALRAFSHDGQELVVWRGARAGEKLEKDSWTVGKTKKESEEISLNYYLVPTRPAITWQTRKRIVVGSTFAHFTGGVALLRPKHFAETMSHKVSFKWQGFQEAGWKVASTFSNKQEGFTVKRTLDEFAMATFMAGTLRVTEKTFRQGKVCCVLPGTRWNFGVEDFASSALSIVKTTKHFMKEKAKSSLFIGVIPIATKSPIPQGMAGLGLTESMLIFLQPDESLLWHPANDQRVMQVVAHEYLHQWFGGTIKPQRPTGYLIWFLEGFTDYYSLRMLLKASVIDKEGYVAAFNVLMEEYSKSPVRELSNHNIVLNYNRRFDVKRLPYLRGALLAAILDCKIRELTNGQKRLDHMIYEMLQVSRKDTSMKWSTEDIFAAVRKFTNKEFEKQFRRYVVHGDLLPLPPRALEPGMSFEVDRKYSPELARLLRIKTARHGGHRRGKDKKHRPEAFIPRLFLK